MKKAAHLIDLPKVLDSRGNLSFIEACRQVPFRISRAYWIYDVPGGETRGGHAFRHNQEFIVALSGSFDVVLDNGKRRRTWSLNRSYYGLYVPRGYWRQMQNFSTNSLALILASEPYDRQDYLYRYEDFVQLRQEGYFDRPEEPRMVSAKKVIEAASKYSDIISRNAVLNPRSGAHATEPMPTILPTVNDAKLLDLNKIHYSEGNLTVIQGGVDLPYDLRRVFYLYDVPGGESRGAHAHRQCHQFLVAAGGAFEVLLDDGVNRRTVQLNRPFYGLHIPPGIWASEQSFSSGSPCLVLASHPYDEADYINNYNDFLAWRHECR